MQFYDYFLQMCAKKGVSPTKACKDMGLSSSAQTRWSKRGSVPNSSTLMRMAMYFDVPFAEFANFGAIEGAEVNIIGRSEPTTQEMIEKCVNGLPVVKQEYLLKYLQLTFPEMFADEM